MKIDIHRHGLKINAGEINVISLQIQPTTDIEKVLAFIPEDVVISAGVHPWNASEWSNANMGVLESVLCHSRVSIIGEIGLDKVCGIPYEFQLNVLEAQLRLAEKVNKPVIIHNVGYQSEFMSLKKKYNLVPSWILHGFRGKREMAEQLLKTGFCLSFGMRYQLEALCICPLDRLFLETDESENDLTSHYKKVAKELGITEDLLETAIYSNFNAIFSK